ncbi:hypothetical protein BD310DRAFT_139085 [Dichomitus squalens]|uniref:Uncharacterized protein n=1 Tax=Dichomitus squalens TaxID=114155 RepID=A0A4V2K6U1_9APHY|nr:hypothetical protein BD310DRAFT_139085 [Dichomitus squalens]
MPKRSSKWITTTRRPPSARLRGIPAPHIRTSLSPDSILRRRARARRRRTTASDIIEISSDSDLEALPPPFLRRRSREIIDLTHLPSTPPPDPQPRRMLDVDDNVAPHSRRSTPPRQTSPAQSASRPTWLRAALGELHSAYDGVRLVRLFSEIGANPHMPSSWLMKCQECGDDKVCRFPKR